MLEALFLLSHPRVVRGYVIHTKEAGSSFLSLAMRSILSFKSMGISRLGRLLIRHLEKPS
jgi:hypothetical protein